MNLPRTVGRAADEGGAVAVVARQSGPAAAGVRRAVISRAVTSSSPTSVSGVEA
jgi:hypothetical protein